MALFHYFSFTNTQIHSRKYEAPADGAQNIYIEGKYKYNNVK